MSAQRTEQRSAAGTRLQPVSRTAQPRENPLREGLRLERMPEPCTMVICGATGDLAERRLAPALYNLMLGGFLPPEFTVVGFARRELSDEEFAAFLREGVNRHSRNRPVKESIWESFCRGIEYQPGQPDDPAA
jgi:glucose-6-phosphate 1-dehydrogenase